MPETDAPFKSSAELYNTTLPRMVTPPRITDVPHHHPGCCLSLSTTLLHRLGQLQPARSLIISIGSGSGLLEALLQRQCPQSRVVGLEVNASVNRYLAPENSVAVKGTWDVYDKASEADTWLFVYPRSPGLIAQYLKLARLPSTIAWLGPKGDWESCGQPFREDGSFSMEMVAGADAGLAGFETMFVMTRSTMVSPERAASSLGPSLGASLGASLGPSLEASDCSQIDGVWLGATI